MCDSHYQIDYQDKNRDRLNAKRRGDTGKNRRQNLKRTTTLTVDQFDSRLASQGNRCAICGADEPGGVGTFHVDHDHECCAGRKSCGQCIRGLLCQNCNLLLGHARDDVFILESAIAYLQRNA